MPLRSMARVTRGTDVPMRRAASRAEMCSALSISLQLYPAAASPPLRGACRVRPYRVPRDQFRIAMVSSWPDALAGPWAPGAPL